ncbi:hypothetical protein ES702_06203 [subsurface metagenome]
MSKIAGIAGIVKYGVIGGIFAGISYVAYKIWKEFEKAKPPAIDEPFAEIPEGHGLVVQYKTIYVGAWIGWLFPMTNIMNTKSEFIKHLEWVRDTFPKEMKVVECYCIMEDKYEHYLGVAYQILNFLDDLPETTTISEKPKAPKYPPIILESGELYQPEWAITQEIYDQNIVEKEAYEEVIESIITAIPEESQYAVLKLTEAEIREQEGATSILVFEPEPEPIIAPIIAPIQEIVKPIYDIIEPTPEPINIIISEPKPEIVPEKIWRLM